MEIRTISTGIILTFLSITICCGQQKMKEENYHKRIEEIVSKMTIEEKIEQLSGMGRTNNEFGDPNVLTFGTKGNKRVGIPDLIMGHGITGVRSGRDASTHSTYFCSPIAIACSWDTDLYYRVGTAIAKEMRALGQNLSLGPPVNIIRHPFGGRNWEFFSEDPYLTSRMIVPFVKAMQSNGIICGPKHFMANNQELNRFDINNVIDERTLNEIYLPAFKAAVKEGGALNIMASYNRVNGTFMCENKYFLTDILRNKWGFKGFVLSDFGQGVRSTFGAINAGLNVEMFNKKYYGESLIQAVKNGEIAEKRIDELLGEKLYAMMKIGMFDKDYPTFSKSIVHSEENQNIALEVARKSPVLLKNEAQTLPLNISEIKTVAVIGPNAKNFMKKGNPNYADYLQGGGSGRVYYYPDAILTPYNEIKKIVGSKVNVLYAQGCNAPNTNDTTGNINLLKEALSIASKVDKVILVMGLSGANESEGKDKITAGLPNEQKLLIEQILKTNPNVILTLVAGSYIEMESWYKQVSAILFCPYAGERMAEGIAEILFGKYSPEGKLAISYPFSAKDYPVESLYKGKGFSVGGNPNIYSEGIYVGYRYFEKQKVNVQYPFGYGLSYSTFNFSNLQMPDVLKEDSLQVSFTLNNTGKYVASEVVQLYINPQNPKVDRPVKELKGFAKVSLKPGQSQVIKLTLGKDCFAYYDVISHNWKTDPGKYMIMIGASSADIQLRKEIILNQ